MLVEKSDQAEILQQALVSIINDSYCGSLWYEDVKANHKICAGVINQNTGTCRVNCRLSVIGNKNLNLIQNNYCLNHVRRYKAFLDAYIHIQYC